MIRWIFSDIDGTILPYYRPFSGRTVTTLSHCPVPLSLVSGRMPVQMRPMIDQLRLDGIHCANNGAVIFEMTKGKIKVLKTFPIKVPTVLKVMTELTTDFPRLHYCWYELNHWYVNGMDPDIEEEAEYTGIPPLLKQRSSISDEVLAMLVIVPDATQFTRVSTALRRLALPDIRFYATGGGYLEITSSAAGKAAVVNYVRQRYSLSKSELAAFGDGGNDLAMLNAVGWPLAVDNAAEEVKAVARRIVPSAENDGVAQQIERWAATGQLG
ncbi:HAD family hydrolase [uncultured Limosilactobacillus sp.]|uniref:HAD family hydrolase n=1 Tax=uncultured Limosilactobacillus sp. TaxID=2837629 RepID=UPI0025DB3394|nr:HAD family hydrolase [uncultured Limosilactobacillus sp.]